MRARAWGGRPPDAWSLALLYLTGGIALAGGAVAPMSAQAPVGLDEALAAVCLTAAAGIYLIGRRLPGWARLPLLTLGGAWASLLVAHSHTAAGVAIVGMEYPWLAAYAALFLGHRAAGAAVALGSAGFAAGIVASGLPHLGAVWGGVTMSTAGTALVLDRLTEALRRQSEIDPLTGAANRAGLDRVAAREIARVTRRGDPLAVAVLDIDDLKGVNDVSGHAAGDALLRRAVTEWLAGLRGADALARIGGDEFVILLPGSDQAGAERLVERLAREGDVPFSAGVAAWSAGDGLDALLARADEAMYARKRIRAIVRPAVLPAQRPAENARPVRARPTRLPG